MNIYTKLTLLCLSLVISTAGVIFFFADNNVKRNLQAEILAGITQKADDIGSNIGRFMNSRINEVKIASQNEYFKQLNFNQVELNEKLQSLAEVDDSYFSFSLFDINRNRLGDSKGLNIGVQHSKSLYWSKIDPETKGIITDISLSESANQVVIHFASIIQDDDPLKKRVLVSRMLVDELIDVVGNYSLGLDENRRLDIHLLDKDGTILYSSIDKQAILKKKYENIHLVEEAGIENLIESEGIYYFISKQTNYLDFGNNNWTLVLSIPEERALAPLIDLRNGILWTVIPIVVISALVSLFAANLFVKPIIKLSNAAKNMGKGDLKQDLQINSNDEIGTLAKQLSKSGEALINQIEQQRKSNEKLKEQNEEIEKQRIQLKEFSDQIKDSISYAERILQATLPPMDTLKRIFPNSFVMFKPKDVIGGDFYWFERVRKGSHEYMIIACADSTGHGVPGAIMSIMGSNQLTNIVYYQNYLDPQKIITRLDKVIKFELQRENKATQRDGMEVAVCAIDLDSLKMEYSGLGIPLRLIRNGSKEMETFKADKLMAGGIKGDEQEVQSQIHKETIQLGPGDKIYLASDGYQDQFGGENDRKFMLRNFNILLEETSKLSMAEQEKQILDTFNDWSKNTFQTDDVTVLGIEIV